MECGLELRGCVVAVDRSGPVACLQSGLFQPGHRLTEGRGGTSDFGGSVGASRQEGMIYKVDECVSND